MDIQNVVAELRQEITRIERAIAALTGLGSQPTRRGRPPKASQAKTAGQKPHRMSAAARKRISEAMKQRWAQWKGKSAPKKAETTSKKTMVRRPMSAAARKRLSAMMKARWAAKNKAMA